MSEMVNEMNGHLGRALQLIEVGCADNNANIREEMKGFFGLASKIEREIAKKEVSSLDRVKRCELEVVYQQQEKVAAFTAELNERIAEIEARMRGVLAETEPILEV
jgi:BMFP domain-containing protein YqiC